MKNRINSIAIMLFLFGTTVSLKGQESSALSAFLAEHAQAMGQYMSRAIKTSNPKSARFSKPVQPKKEAAKKVTQKTQPNQTNAPAQPSKAEKLAFESVKEAAEGGYVPAQDLLAYCYATGTGVKADERLAFAWYLKAALAGSQSAQGSLIACVRDGIGVKKDKQLAQLIEDITASPVQK